ncbi:MAG: C39 family peptidase [Lachnospiraceae bacterium]|nr:C39 family peptidase [Lachnospiraceae bacterium]
MKRDTRRRQQKERINLFIKIALMVILICSIKNINTRLDKIQKMLEQMGFTEAREVSAATNIKEKNDYNEEINYVETIDVINVEKPMDRTAREVLQKLNELGNANPTIMEVYQNHSLYPDDLLAALANNPEMADFVAGYLNRENHGAEGLTASEKEQEHPLFLQWDPRWGYKSYGTESNIGLAGCGPTCLSMVLFYLTGDETLTPDKIAKYSMDNGYYMQGTGTAWALMEDVPKRYNIKVSTLSKSADNMKAVLDNDSIIICSMGKGDFTAFGHFIVIYGYDENGFFVNDPNCIARSRRNWTYSEIEKQIKKIWVYTNA